MVLLIGVEQKFTVTIQKLKTDRDRCLSRASLHGSILERHHAIIIHVSTAIIFIAVRL